MKNNQISISNEEAIRLLNGILELQPCFSLNEKENEIGSDSIESDMARNLIKVLWNCMDDKDKYKALSNKKVRGKIEFWGFDYTEDLKILNIKIED